MKQSSESKLKAQTIALIIRLENGEFRNVRAIVPEFIDPKRPAPVIACIRLHNQSRMICPKE